MGTVKESAGKAQGYPGVPEKVERNEELRRLHEEGVGIQSLARRFKISNARVRQVIDAGERKHPD